MNEAEHRARNIFIVPVELQILQLVVLNLFNLKWKYLSSVQTIGCVHMG